MSDPQATSPDPSNIAPVRRYTVAILATLVVVLLRFALVPSLGHDAPLILFVVAILAAAWYGGLGPGLFATALSVAAGDFFFISPLFSFAVERPSDRVRLFLYVVVGAWASSVCEAMHRARRQAVESARTARTRGEALGRAEGQLQLMVESVKDYAIFSIDPEGRVATWNTGAERLFGYAEAEILGQGSDVLFTPEDRAEGVPGGERGKAESTGHAEDERWHMRKDGGRFLASGMVNPIRDEAGRLRGFTKVARDITRRKQDEEAARAASVRVSDLLEGMHEGVSVLDREWRYVYVNAAAERLNGYRRQDVLDECLWDLFPAVVGTEIEHNFRRATTEEVEFETFYRPWGRWFHIKAYPAPGGGVCAQFRETSEEKRAEEALRASEGRFRFLDALGEATRAMADPTAIMASTTRMLGEYLKTSRCAYADVEADGDRFAIRDDWTDGAPSTVGSYSLDLFGPRAVADMRGGRSLVIRDVDRELRTGEGADTFNGIGVKAIVCCPLVKGGRLLAMMAVHQDAPRDWTAREVALVEEVVERSWAHVERARVTRSLGESDENFRTLAESIPQLAWMARPDGHIFWYNRRWYDYTGKSPEDMEGWGWQSVHDPESLPRVVETWTASIRGGVACDMTFPLRRADGRFRTFLTRVEPFKDQEGRVLLWFGTNTDIEDQKRAEERERRHAEQSWKLAAISNRLNTAHDVASVVRVVAEEARALIGAHLSEATVTTDEGGGREVHAASYSEKYDAWRGREVRYDRVGPPSQVRPGGGTVRLTQAELEALPGWRDYAESQAGIPPLRGWLSAALVGRSGRQIGFLRLSDNVEGEFTEDDEAVLAQLSLTASVAVENARLYDELRKNDQRKDEFLAMLAHELRNPLAAINTAVSLSSRSGLQEHIEWSMEVIGRQMKHLTRLIDDLMDVSRITRGKIALKKDRLDVAPVVAGAVEAVRPLYDERKHELLVSVPKGEFFIDADPTRLEQILTNLLTNAGKYTESGGKVWLSARGEGDRIVFSVRDTGLGIPPDVLPHVFDLFAQGERSLARSEGGLGIGLTIVKRLAEMHGGTVAAASDGVGRGSEFSVNLPAAPRPTGPSAAGTGSTPGERRASRILVVDDNVDTARGMARLLKLLGHDVRVAHTGPEAIEAARGHRPEVVLLDIGLPGMSGYEVASQLRREDCCAGTLIIAISGYGQEEDRRRSKASGFDHHLVKPIDHDALLSLLASGSVL